MNNEAPTMTQSPMVVRSSYETVIVADETNSRHSTASVSSSTLSDANPYLNPYDSVNRDDISTIPNSYIPLLIQTYIPCENDERENNIQDTDVDSNVTPRSDRGSAKLKGDHLVPLNINNITEHHRHDSSDHDYPPNSCDSQTQDVADSTYLTPVFERY
ncbi:hypothetical protein SNE40_006014 [Patella caerulea]|uniref:Uncharacterized protein n=1 Tax=Patella caerulea TaxID=87958 RepID=A0AAN8JZI0_PATCE